MRKVYLEGMLGEKFGSEWNLAVNSPAEAMQAMLAQRPGMKQYILEGENIQGYDILIGDEYIQDPIELLLNDPGMTQSYTFVPVVAGSKNAGLMIILGIALIVATGGGAIALSGANATAAGLVGGQAAGLSTTMAANLAAAIPAGSTAAAAGLTTATGALTTQGAIAAVGTTAAGGTAGTLGVYAFQGARYLGMGLLMGGASMMLAPDVPDGNNASQAENYLFSGPVNTVKQGEPIPLVYGRIVTGSKTVMGSLFTTSSNNESQVQKTRKLVGIGGFRNDGDSHGETSPAGRYSIWDHPDMQGPKRYW